MTKEQALDIVIKDYIKGRENPTITKQVIGCSTRVGRLNINHLYEVL